jgi:ubiquinone/menaquinone biosynthesis C-methylase UbiE
MSATGSWHSKYVHRRRVRTLSESLAPLFPRNTSVLDVGCGDGLLANLIKQARPDLRISGIDVFTRETCYIPVTIFDGRTVPFAAKSIDVVMFADVLHHTEDPMALLREAVRVARLAVIIKDHTMNGLLAYSTLKFMDRVGNKRYGVALPHNYWPEKTWRESFDALRLNPVTWNNRLGLYPWPASVLFERGLHFVAMLEPAKSCD